MLSAWVIALLTAASIVVARRSVLKERMVSACADVTSRMDRSTGLQKLMWMCIAGLTLLLLVQGLAYPSNSTDTLRYHLPRVVAWIGQGSVDHYPSHNYSQIYMPPFAEYMVMNVNILHAGDRYCNTVEWLFLTACAVSATRLTDLLLIGRRDSGAAHLLSVCLPVAVLQSTTANNDIVVSFFVLTSFFYGYRWIRRHHPADGLWLGASFGLACLTKATAYLYLAPLVAWISALAVAGAAKDGMRTMMRAITPALVFASILLNMYARNLDLAGNLMGMDKGNTEPGINATFSPRATFSNLLKNLGGQMGPYPLNIMFDSALHKVHRALDIPVKIQGTHFFDMDYRGAPNLPTHDSTAPNPMHTCLLLAALSWMAMRRLSSILKPPSPIELHAAMVVLQLIIFSAFLKWQPYHTRLLMPLFFLSIPLICHCVDRWEPGLALKTAGVCIFAGIAMFTCVFNDTRPLVSTSFTQAVSIRDERFDKFFTERFRPLKAEMVRTKGIMDSMGCRTVGLLMDDAIPEYILFHDAYAKGRRAVHLNVRNISRRLEGEKGGVDCMVSNTLSDSAIVRNGRVFRNRTPGHTRIWVFR